MKKNAKLEITSTPTGKRLAHSDFDPILNISTGYIYLFADLMWVNLYGYDIKYGDGCTDWIIGDDEEP